MKIARFSVDGWESYGRVEGERVHLLMPDAPGYDGGPFDPDAVEGWQQVSGLTTTGFGGVTR